MNKFVKGYIKGAVGTGLFLAFVYGYAYGEKDTDEKSKSLIEKSKKDILGTMGAVGKCMAAWPVFLTDVAYRTAKKFRENSKADNEKDGSC